MDYETLLYDRIEMIKTINEKYDLENSSYISFSGGKDSTILHYLIDLALPNNRIPRVFINTGIEYLDIIKYVKELQSRDDRIVIIKPKKNIKSTLEKYGYPMKSKQHSHNLSIYQHSGMTKSVKKYLGVEKGNNIFKCPQRLAYQFSTTFNIKCSEQCCNKMKKEPAKEWAKENNKNILLTGMRKEEGGQRKSAKCTVFDETKNLVKFHPLLVVDEEWIEEFIKRNNIEVCKLYLAPYNFRRTGCKGCPFSLDLQEQLDVMSDLLPIEKKQCEIIWKPIYEEYRRIGYRLKKDGEFKQLSLLDEE